MQYINYLTHLPFEYLLSYNRYIIFQERLRKHRKELVLFCQHPPTITAGIQSQAKNLLLSLEELNEKNIEVLKIKRGGDYTAHEPGQCIIYVHLDFKKRELVLRDFIFHFLKITCDAIKEIWSIDCTIKLEGEAGIYWEYNNESYKVASLGLSLQNMFSSYGLAINLNNNLKTFSYINPCGQSKLKMINIEMVKNYLIEKNSPPTSSYSKEIGAKLCNDFMDTWKKNFNSYIIQL